MWRSPGLAGWLHWFEHSPIHQKVVGSIPDQGIYLDYGFDPVGVHTGGNQSMFLSHIDVSLSLSLSLPPSLFEKNQ